MGKLAINRKVLVGEAKTCTTCKGQGHIYKTKNERKVVEVHIEKGATHNQKISFRGMADETPGRETGDVHFVVQEKDHDLFKRKGADLLLMQEISVNQALTGFSYKFKHLDGRDVVIKTKPGEVIQAEVQDPSTGRTMPYMTMVSNEGMPSRGN